MTKRSTPTPTLSQETLRDLGAREPGQLKTGRGGAVEMTSEPSGGKAIPIANIKICKNELAE